MAILLVVEVISYVLDDRGSTPDGYKFSSFVFDHLVDAGSGLHRAP
jgi:hypothetical protein